MKIFQPPAGTLYLEAHPCTSTKVPVSNVITQRLVYQETGYTYGGRNVIRSALPPYSHEACQGREFSY